MSLDLRKLTPEEEHTTIVYLATRSLGELTRRTKLLKANLRIQFRQKNLPGILHIQKSLELLQAAKQRIQENA